MPLTELYGRKTVFCFVLAFQDRVFQVWTALICCLIKYTASKFPNYSTTLIIMEAEFPCIYLQKRLKLNINLLQLLGCQHYGYGLLSISGACSAWPLLMCEFVLLGMSAERQREALWSLQEVFLNPGSEEAFSDMLAF